MAKMVEFEGKSFEFPDGTSDDEVLSFLGRAEPKAKTDLFSLEGAKSLVTNIGPNIAQGILGLQQSGLEEVQNARDYQRERGVVTADPEDEAATRQSIQEKRLALAAAKADIQANSPENPSYPLQIAQGVVQSVAQNAPGIAVSVATRNPVPALSAASLMQEGQTYAKDRTPDAQGNLKASVADALVNARMQGMVEAGFEAVPLASLLQNIGKTGVAQLAKDYIWKELATEIPTTIAQDLSDWSTVDQNMPVGEFLRKLRSDVIDTAVSTPFAAGATAGMAHGQSKLVELAQGKRKDEKIADLRAEAEAELAKVGMPEAGELSGGVTPNYSAPIAAPEVSNPDLPEMELTEQDQLDAAEQMKRMESGARHVPEDPAAVADIEDLAPRMEAQPFKKAEGLEALAEDIDPNMSREVALRRLETDYPNAQTHDQREITAGSNPNALGLNLRQYQLQPGDVVALGGDIENFPPTVKDAMAQTVKIWADKWMPGARIVLNLDTFTDEAVGSYTQLNSGIHVITPRELVRWDKHVPNVNAETIGYNTFTQQQTLYALTHEFGHALVMQRFMEGMPQGFQGLLRDLDQGRMLTGEEMQMLPAEQAAVLAEFQALRGTVLGGKLTAADLTEKWLGTWKVGKALMKTKDLERKTLYAHAKEALAKDGKTFEGATALDLVHAMGRDSSVDAATSNAKAEAYFLSFNEYMAEQFSRYAYTKRIEEGTPLGRFFTRALDTLRKFFREMKTVKGANGESAVKPGTSFEQWVEGLARTGRLVEEKARKTKPRKVERKRAVKDAEGLGGLDTVTQKAVEANPQEPTEEEQLAEDPAAKEKMRRMLKAFVDPDLEEYKHITGLIYKGQMLEALELLQPFIDAAVKKDTDLSKGVEFPQEVRADLAGLSPAEWRDSKLVAQASALWGKLGAKSPFFKRFFGDWESGAEHASKVVDANGKPLAVYHGGPLEIEFFDPTLRGKLTGADSAKKAFFFAQGYKTAGFYADMAANGPEGSTPKRALKPEYARKAAGLRERVEKHFAVASGARREAGRLTREADTIRDNVYTAGTIFEKARGLRNRVVDERRARAAAEAAMDIFMRESAEHDKAKKELADLQCPENMVNAVPFVGRYYLNMRNPLVVGEAVYSDGLFTRMQEEALANGHDGVIIKNAADPYEDETIYMVFAAEQIKAEKNTGTFDPTDTLHWDKDTPEGLGMYEAAKKVSRIAKDLGTSTAAVKALHFFHRMQDAVIQVQQKAFTNGNVGLQMFNIYLQRFVGMKNALLRHPDEVVKKWEKLGKENFARFNAMLQDEFMSGGHVTELVQESSVWVHRAGPAYREWAKSHGIDPVSERGLEIEQLYLDAKNSILKHIGTLEEVAVGIARDRFGTAPAALQLRVNEIRREARKWRETPFVPQTRFGRYVVQVKGRNQETGKVETLHREHFESKAERQKAARGFAALLQSGETVKESELSEATYAALSLPKDFLQTLADTGEFTDEQLLEIGEAMTPLRATKLFARYEREASKIRGASSDTMKNFAHWSWHNANFIAKLEYRRKLNKAIALTRADIRQVQNQVSGMGERQRQMHELDRVVGIMTRSREYIMHPPSEFFQTRAVVSLLYLMYNVKTALVNFTGMLNTWAALTAEQGDLRGNGIFAKAVKDLTTGNLSPAEQWMLDKALSDGVVDQSYAYFLAGQANSGNLMRMYKTTPAGNAWRTFVDLGMKPFQLIEKANRRMTMLMFFRAELQTGVKAGLSLTEAREEAYSEAERKTRLLQNDYTSGNRPELLRGKKSIFFIFFSYMQFMTWVMSGGYERGVRAQSRALGQTPRSVLGGSTMRMWLLFALMAGVEGLPGAENLLDLLSWLWRKMSGGENLRVEMRKFVEDLGLDSNTVLHGLAFDLGGFDLSGSVGLGRILPGTDVLTQTGQKPAEAFGKMALALPGPLGGVVKNALGLIFSEDPIGKRLASNLPGAAGSLAKAVEYARHGAETRQGADIARNAAGKPRELTGAEIGGQALGFRPAVLAKGQELRALQMEERNYWTKRRSGLLRDYWLARKEKDREAVADVQKSRHEFNAEAPAEGLRISGKDIMKSLKARKTAVTLDERNKAGGKQFREVNSELQDLMQDGSTRD